VIDVTRDEFERQALAHIDALYSFALKLARSHEDAEDLVSDTFLRALERWQQYRPGTNIRAWLFTILYHVFVSRQRRANARETVGLHDRHGVSSVDARVGRRVLLVVGAMVSKRRRKSKWQTCRNRPGASASAHASSARRDLTVARCRGNPPAMSTRSGRQAN